MFGFYAEEVSFPVTQNEENSLKMLGKKKYYFAPFVNLEHFFLLLNML